MVLALAITRSKYITIAIKIMLKKSLITTEPIIALIKLSLILSRKIMRIENPNVDILNVYKKVAKKKEGRRISKSTTPPLIMMAIRISQSTK